MFRSNSRFVGLKEIFTVMNVKSRRGFAWSVDGESSDSSVNRGGKSIQIFMYACTIFKLFVVCFVF